jgi:hypothetical protein
MTHDDTTPDGGELELRDRAMKQLKKRRDLGVHVLMYVTVNAFLVTVWAVTIGPDGFFWPVFVMAGWGIGLIANVYDVFFANDFSEGQIRREMDHLARHG